MSSLSIDLNDAFFVAPELKAYERQDYTPGDVDREKIYAAWENLYRNKGKKFPTTHQEMSELGEEYLLLSLKYRKQGRIDKASGLMYFGTLLNTKACLLRGDDDLVVRYKLCLRDIERLRSFEDLLPKS